MKKLIFYTISTTLLLISCNQKNKETPTTDSDMMNNNSTMHDDSTMINNDTKMMDENSNIYSCPMHPEVQGQLNDKCPKCGMKLTVPSPENAIKK